MRVIDAGKVPEDFQRQRDAATKALSFLKERHLTVKLNGHAEAPDQRRGRTMSSSAGGAQPLTPHGPLQRLLEVLAEAQPFIQRLLSLSVGQQGENDHKCDAERKVAPNDLQGRSPLNLKPEHQTGNDKPE